MNVTHFKGVADECAITYFMSLNGNLVVINNTFLPQFSYHCSVILKKQISLNLNSHAMRTCPLSIHLLILS